MYYVLIRESCKAWVGGQIFAKLTPKLEKSQITRIKISWRKEFIVLKIIIQHLWPRHIFCLWYEDIIRTKLFAFIGEAEVETSLLICCCKLLHLKMCIVNTIQDTDIEKKLLNFLKEKLLNFLKENL